MATSMVGLGRIGQSYQGNFLFTVSKATGSKFSSQNFKPSEFKSFSTVKTDKPVLDYSQSLFKKRAIDGGSSMIQKAFNMTFNSYQPFSVPKELLGLFGFNPETATECPILTPPSIDQLGPVLVQACPKPGMIYTGIRNLSNYGTGDSHFYIVAAHCGNLNKIATDSGLEVDLVRQSLTSPMGVLAQWAGNIMAGGGTIQLDKQGESVLMQMAREEMARQNLVIGRGDLTVGRDQVELSRPERVLTGGASLFSFLARTMYFHALSGSVLHMQYVTGGGDIYWAWVGAGGKGFNSREVNNFTAIDLNLGMWPDMAKSIMGFYSEPDLMKLFVSGDPEDYQKLISMLVSASQQRKGTMLDVLQRAQVSLGFGKRVKDSLNNGAFVVKGDKSPA
jgi:hypothetical protein